jgi:bacteriocin-like protein
MKFQKIEGFKKMTNEAMAKVIGGGRTDTMTQKTNVPLYKGTKTTCGTGPTYQLTDACTLQDFVGFSQD